MSSKDWISARDDQWKNLLGDKYRRTQDLFSRLMMLNWMMLYANCHEPQVSQSSELNQFLLTTIDDEYSTKSLQFLITRALSYVNFRDVTFRSPSLELGVGNARTSNLVFADKAIDIGSNPTDDLVVEARRVSKVHHEVRLMDAQEIPIDADSIATIIANNCIYHVPDKRRVLREAHRVLIPGGRFYFDDLAPGANVLSKTFSETLVGAQAQPILQAFHEYRANDYGRVVYKNATLEELEDLARSIGFNIVERRPYASCELFDFFVYPFDFAFIFGLGPSSGRGYLNENERRFWRGFIVDHLASLIERDRARCEKAGEGVNRFFVLEKQ